MLYFKKIVSGLMFCAAMASSSTPPQTTQDHMEGDRAVINGQKQFLSGMNIAWITSNTFGSDVGDSKIDINAFTDKVKKIRKAGGNSLRWWLHTDASNCPKIDETGAVTGIGSQTIANISAALDTAYSYGVVLDLCLFSFDMLVPGSGDGKAGYSSYNLQNNVKFLKSDANLQTYLDKALKPILDAVGNHPAVMCWEVWNEAEGMLASADWSHVTEKLPMNDILRITNRIAGFVHRNTVKMVSSGIAATSYLSSYSDATLKAAGGDDDGYLDFYMVHYYPEWQGESESPFHNPASSWGMDRPLLIGEFPAKSWSSSTTGPSSNQPLKSTKTIEDAFDYAFNNGYAGAMSWAMSESDASFFGDYTSTAPALEALFTKHRADILIKEVAIEEMKGDHVMALTLDALPIPDDDNNNYFELGTSDIETLSGKTAFKFDLFVKSGSGTNLQIQPVIKVKTASEDYVWSPASDEAFLLGDIEQGKWVTVTIPITAFGAESVEIVREILLQYWAVGEPCSGTIFFDDMRADNDILADFNEEGTAWSTGANEATVNLVKKDGVTSTERLQVTGIPATDGSDIFIRGSSLFLKTSRHADFKVTLFNLAGSLVASRRIRTTASGTSSISLPALSKGSYLAEVSDTRSRVVKTITIY